MAKATKKDLENIKRYVERQEVKKLAKLLGINYKDTEAQPRLPGF